MKVIVFGATGMVGQGVLRECLLDADISSVETVGRSRSGLQNAKLKELLLENLWDYSAVEADLKGYDACFFCLGTPSAGKAEVDYTRVTYDLTLAAAQTLSRLNPKMTFIYVSGDGADSTEQGRVMWARVRGKTENAILRLPFKAAYIFRPGIIQPLHGIQSKTRIYRITYSLMKPLLPLLRAAMPNLIATTEQIGRAMILVAKNGHDKKILTARDFEAVVKRHGPRISLG